MHLYVLRCSTSIEPQPCHPPFTPMLPLFQDSTEFCSKHRTPRPCQWLPPNFHPYATASLEPSPCLPPRATAVPIFCGVLQQVSNPVPATHRPNSTVVPRFYGALKQLSNPVPATHLPSLYAAASPIQSKYIHNRMWILFMNNDII